MLPVPSSSLYVVFVVCVEMLRIWPTKVSWLRRQHAAGKHGQVAYLRDDGAVDLEGIIAASFSLRLKYLLDGDCTERVLVEIPLTAGALLAALSGYEAASASTSARAVRGIRCFVVVVVYLGQCLERRIGTECITYSCRYRRGG
jgi:hypothetical protein